MTNTFTPLQQEVYNDINKYRWWRCTIQRNKAPPESVYLLSYGRHWNTPEQKKNPFVQTEIKVGFPPHRNQRRFQYTELETSVPLTSLISVDEAAPPLEEICIKHPCPPVMQLARAFYLTKKIKELEAEQKMLSCVLELPAPGSTIKVVITHTKGRCVGYYPLTATPNWFGTHKEDVLQIVWNTLVEVDKIETLTSDNEELRKYSKDKRIIWLEHVRSKFLDITGQLDQDLQHINNLLRNLQMEGRNGRRALTPNDQFPELTAQIQNKCKAELAAKNIVNAHNALLLALQQYRAEMTSYLEDYDQFGIVKPGTST